MTHSVGQLAKLVGVSIRTLHHYDQIGLLTAPERTKAGYRTYGEAEVTRLRRIIAYRDLGFDLASIATILDDPSVDPEEHLRLQRSLLEAKLDQLEHMLVGVDAMVAGAVGEAASGTTGDGEPNAVPRPGPRVARPASGGAAGVGIVLGFGLAGAATPWLLNELERSPLGFQPLFAHIALFSLVGLVCAGTVLAYSLREKKGHALFQLANACMWTGLVLVSYFRIYAPEFGLPGAFIGLGTSAWGALIVGAEEGRPRAGSPSLQRSVRVVQEA